jgi:hypothetical protein
MNQYTYHIALTTLPTNKTIDECNTIIKNKYYDGFKTSLLDNCEISKKVEYIDYLEGNNLYCPEAYYMFGSNFKMAYVSVIDSLKFIHNTFSFKEFANASQIITGIPLGKTFNSQLFVKPQESKEFTFIGITHLKLDNNILVSKGIDFLEKAIKKIEKVLNKTEFQLMQSFAWCEITLIQFGKTPKDIYTNVNKIRALHGTDIFDGIYSDAHIFAESSTQLGINYAQFMADNFDTKSVVGLVSEFEWHVRPGHEGYINDAGLLLAQTNLTLGKTDYNSVAKDATLASSKQLLALFNDKKKLKTYTHHVFHTENKLSFKQQKFNAKKSFEHKANPENSIRTSLLKRFDDIKIDDINIHLKQLYISRQCRLNIRKIYHNLHHVMNDQVLSFFFIDMLHYFEFIANEIDEKVKLRDKLMNDNNNFTNKERIKKFDEINTYEQILITRIEQFEKAYLLRCLNAYLHEELPDFQTEHSTSILHIISMYSSFCFVILEALNQEKKPILVSVHNKSNVTILNNINYSVQILFSPEFVFFTITREVINTIIGVKEADAYSEFKKQLEAICMKDAFLAYLLNKNVKDAILNVDYFISDYIRCRYTCFGEYDLFDHWTWMLQCQTPAFYNCFGEVEQDQFTATIIRLIVLRKLLYLIDDSKDGSGKMTCPFPELSALWDAYYQKIQNKIDKVFTNLSDKESEELKKIAIRFIRQFKSIENEKLNHTDYFNYSKDGIINGTADVIKDGKDDDTETRHRDIRLYMYAYLKTIKTLNGDKVRNLWRCKITGTPLPVPSIDDNEKVLYFADPNGGIFIKSYKNQNIYFTMRNKCLQNIWHIATLNKQAQIKNL